MWGRDEETGGNPWRFNRLRVSYGNLPRTRTLQRFVSEEGNRCPAGTAIPSQKPPGESRV